jgi:hypothetical protein
MTTANQTAAKTTLEALMIGIGTPAEWSEVGSTRPWARGRVGSICIDVFAEARRAIRVSVAWNDKLTNAPKRAGFDTANEAAVHICGLVAHGLI